MEDGYDEDIEFGYEVSDEGEGDAVDAVSIVILFLFCSHIGIFDYWEKVYLLLGKSLVWAKLFLISLF